LLVEGFNSDKLKLTVFFVCRILKECQKSTVFKHNNPWVKAILEILREIYDFGQANNQTYGDVIMEIDALYKAFGI
jgi:CCR4-NOT transcription complex subunit 1